MFPAYLLKRPVVTALVLVAIAIAPFILSLLAGEPIDQRYPHSDHNNITNLLTNLSTVLIAITLLILLAKPRELRDFVANGYPNQNIVNALLLDICLVQITLYTFSSAFASAQEPGAAYPLLFLHPFINATCIFFGLYLGLTVPAYLLMFMVSRHDRADRKIFRTRDLILLEPLLIYAFVMGMRSQPPDNLFGFFAILCPFGIFLITEGIEMMGLESPAERRLRLMPLTFKTRFALINLLIYVIIISLKFEIIQLTATISTIVAALLVFYFVGLYQERRQYRQILRKIRVLSAKGPAGEQFNQKVRAYHELRERR